MDSDQVLFGDAGNFVPSVALGWEGFLDFGFMLHTLSILILAALLGSLIGFHPASRRRVDRLREADMPQVFVMYAVIGAVIGLAVAEFGMVVGVVVFGIGGLMRFRSVTDTTDDTVRLIAVTLAGLTAGLGLLPLAVITTLFAFSLVYFFDTHPACRIRIAELPADRLAECTAAYRERLTENRCKIIAERQSPAKKRVEFVFRMPRRSTREQLDAALNGIAPELRGHADWEVA